MSKKNSTKVPARVIKARATRHAVRVQGKEYGSTYQAFLALGLSAGRCVRFRMALKKAGKAVIASENGKKEYKFTLVKAA